MERWTCRNTSRPASHSSHGCAQATCCCASHHVSAGENWRYSLQTSTSKTTANSSRYRTRCHHESGLRVPLAFQGKRGSGGAVAGSGRAASGVARVTSPPGVVPGAPARGGGSRHLPREVVDDVLDLRPVGVVAGLRAADHQQVDPPALRPEQRRLVEDLPALAEVVAEDDVD